MKIVHKHEKQGGPKRIKLLFSVYFIGNCPFVTRK